MMEQKLTANEAFYEISLAICTHVNLTDILHQIVEQTKRLLLCEHASVVLWNSKKRHFESGTSSTDVGTTMPNRVRREGGATRWIIDHNQPLIVPDTSKDPFQANSMIGENQIRAYAGVPITTDDNVIGVLYALSSEIKEFSCAEVDLLTKLAKMVYGALHNARMVQELDELNQFKTTLMQTIVHDLKNPLHIAINSLDLLRADEDLTDIERASYFDNIDVSFQRMQKLITGILEYERLTTIGDIEWGLCELNEIVHEVLCEFQLDAKDKLHTIQLKPQSVPAFIIGDQLLLQQAVGNLLANAIKYTPPQGCITVKIQTGTEHVLRIEDTGVGIKSEELDKIFEPFARFASAQNRAGSGLGLSLAKLIVDRHQGRLTVKSREGIGSVFSIYLPAAK